LNEKHNHLENNVKNLYSYSQGICAQVLQQKHANHWNSTEKNTLGNTRARQNTHTASDTFSHQLIYTVCNTSICVEVLDLHY